MSGINNDWEFLVQCYSPHLVQRLGEISTGYDMHFYAVDAIHEGFSDDFRFNTWFGNGVTDESVVFSIGQELLSLFNGACNILFKDHHKIEIEDIWFKGLARRPFGNLFLRDVRLTEGDVNAGDCYKNEHIEGLKNSQIFTLVHLSKSRDDVFHLLKAFASDPDWTRLSTILEAVERFSNNNQIAIAVDARKKKSFAHTANNFLVLGMSARHGHLNFDPPAQPMGLVDAQQFIKAIVKEYLSEVCRLFLEGVPHA